MAHRAWPRQARQGRCTATAPAAARRASPRRTTAACRRARRRSCTTAASASRQLRQSAGTTTRSRMTSAATMASARTTDYYYGDGYLYQVDPAHHADPAGGQRDPPLVADARPSEKAVRQRPGGLFFAPRTHASGSAKQGASALAEFTLPKNSKITKGRDVCSPRSGKRPEDLQDLPLRPRQRRQPALRQLHHRPRQMRADGPRRADQDQE